MTQFIAAAIIICVALACGCDHSHDSAVARDEAGTQHNEPSESPTRIQTVITNTLGMPMQLIPLGEFRMGSAEPERFGDYSRCEGPQHLVRIMQRFRISRYEVTVEQFQQFVRASNYVTDAELSKTGCNGLDVATGQVVKRPECIWMSPGFAQTKQHPVVCVSWKDAGEFCNWLSAMTGDVYRLPTEAEWEYCCRAGTDTFLTTGDSLDSLRSAGNCGDQSLQAQCPSLNSTAEWDDGFAFTAPAGSFQPNDFGLYDMHGNVGEWCLDWFDADYYSSLPVNDPRGPETTRQWRVVRGGSWYNNPVSCRSSGRHDGVPTEASTTNGFRVVMEIPQKWTK